MSSAMFSSGQQRDGTGRERSSTHSRAVSLPAFSLQAAQQAQQHGFAGLGSGLGGLGVGGGYGLGVSGDSVGALPGWAEEEVA